MEYVFIMIPRQPIHMLLQAALNSFEKNIILLAGGHDKGIPFDELSVFDKKIKCCISFGETKRNLKEYFYKHDYNRNYERGL